MIECKIKKMTIAEKQDYAACCLSEYCEHFGISDERIDKLVSHLRNMKTASNLPKWENEGAMLALAGRGDCLPTDLEDKIPLSKKDEFVELLEATVEVGIVDLYGEETNLPYSFLMKSISVLIHNKIQLPKL